LKLTYGALLESLQATGNWSNLSLKSEEQEWIEDRMRIVRNLLVRKLPTAFLSASHQEHKATSSSEFGTDAHYASELLVILDEQVARHQVDGRTIEQVMQERAEFNSKELSKGHAQDSRREIAKSPDEIRNKLKGSTGSGGPSKFESRDLGGSTSRSAIPQKPASTGNAGIAQSPDDIRKNCRARKDLADHRHLHPGTWVDPHRKLQFPGNQRLNQRKAGSRRAPKKFAANSRSDRPAPLARLFSDQGILNLSRINFRQETKKKKNHRSPRLDQRFSNPRTCQTSSPGSH
jgi:hypothetical protein